MKEIIIKPTKGKIIVLCFLSILMVVASVFVLYMGVSEVQWINIIIGVIGTAFFGYAMVYIVGRTVHLLRNPEEDFIVKINDQGIYDNSSKIAIGLIQWKDIKSAKVTRVFTEKFISIELVDEKAFFEANPPKSNVFQTLNSRFYSPINITLQTSKMTPEALLKIIEEKLAERSSH